jgi:hypothetical protein
LGGEIVSIKMEDLQLGAQVVPTLKLCDLHSSGKDLSLPLQSGGQVVTSLDGKLSEPQGCLACADSAIIRVGGLCGWLTVATCDLMLWDQKSCRAVLHPLPSLTRERSRPILCLLGPYLVAVGGRRQLDARELPSLAETLDLRGLHNRSSRWVPLPPPVLSASQQEAWISQCTGFVQCIAAPRSSLFRLTTLGGTVTTKDGHSLFVSVHLDEQHTPTIAMYTPNGIDPPSNHVTFHIPLTD